MSTTRNRVVGQLSQRTYQRINTIGGQVPPFPAPAIYNGLGGYGGTMKAMTDVVTPGYAKLRAKGIWINNPMSIHIIVAEPPHVKSSTKQAVGSLSGINPNRYNYAQYEYDGDSMTPVFGDLYLGTHSAAYLKWPLPYSLNSLRNKVIIETSNRVEPAKSQSLVTGLELQKSIDMIRDRVHKLADVVQLCKGRKFKQLEFMFPGKRAKLPKKVILWDESGIPIIRKNGRTEKRFLHQPKRLDPNRIDEATKLWLEYRYGWSPLVHDIVDSLKATYADDLRKELSKREIRTAKSGASQSQTVVSTETGSSFGTVTAQLVQLHEVSISAYVLYGWYQPEGFARRMNDFGIFDVPRAIWEICPWSFVADWFLPVGDFLGALTPKFGVDIKAAGMTTEYKLTVTRTVTGFVSDPPTGNGRWTNTQAPIGTVQKCTYTAKGREVGLPLPSYPPLEVKLNLKRLVDAVALFRGVTSTGFKPFLRK